MLNGNRRLLDGVLLVIIGAVLLLNSLGIIPWGVWTSLWRFWPVLLILAGVSVMTHQRIPFLALLIAALVVILVLGYAFPTRFEFGWTFGRRSHTGNSLPVAADAVGKPLRASLTFGAGDLRIGDTTDQAFTVDVDHYGPVPIISSASGSAGTTLEARSGLAGSRVVSGRTETWRVAFNRDLPLDVTVNAGACDAKLDFRAYNLARLVVSAGASDLDISIGERGPSVDVTVSSAASDVELRLPPSAGVRLRAHSVLSENNLRQAGLVREGDYWVSEGFEAAAQKINVVINGVIGDINIIR
ncbi:MAG: LiaI-LiaF-like domain-containing protein [Chloroflexota bacterium]